MDFLVRMPTLEWQAAPLLVPKPGSKAQLGMAVDPRPVNAAAISKSCLMPHPESEIHVFAASTVFASLDFVWAYWQIPFHEDSSNKGGGVTPKEVMDIKWALL